MPFCVRGIELAGQNQTRPAYYYFGGDTPPFVTYTATQWDAAYWGTSYVHIGYAAGSTQGPAMVSYTITPVSGPGQCTSADAPPPTPNPDPSPENCCDELRTKIQNLSAQLNSLQPNILSKVDGLQQQINASNQKIKNIESDYIPKNEISEIIQSALFQSIQWSKPKFALIDSEINGWLLLLQGISASLALVNQFLEEIKKGADSYANWVLTEFPKFESYVNEQIGRIYQEIVRNKPKNYDSDIAELRRLINEVSGTATFARREARDARTIAEKAYELAQATNNELLKFKDSMRSALESLRVELKADIDYVTERALAAMQRLEAFIKSELAFLESSTLNAMLRLQTRIQRNELLIKDAQDKANKSIKNANLAINNDIKAIKLNIETTLDKATLAIKDSAKAFNKATKAIELGDINNLQTIDLRIRLGAIPQQIKNEIVSKISPIAEEYARKYAPSNMISMGEIQRGYNYSEDVKLDRLQKQLDAKWNASLKKADLESNGAFDRLNALAAATEKMRQEFARKTDLEYFVSQYGENFSPAKTAELQQIRVRESAELRAGINQITKFQADVDQFINDKNSERLAYREEARKIAIPEINEKVVPVALKQAEVEKEIANIKRRLTERELVDKEVNEKLKIITPVLPELNAKIDRITPTILGIPAIMDKIPDQTVGKIPNAISPLIPTIPQIGVVVKDKVCNPQCQLPSISAGNNATDAVNRAKNDLADKIDKTNNAAQTGLLVEILSRLGDKIPGGLSGKLVDGFKWLHLDRVLNVLTFIATVQNHLMLSNDIGQTLIGAINNGLQLIGLKDDKQRPINVGQIISGTIENLVKGIVGTENYATLSAQWAKANRIYQASTNVLNSFMGLTQTVLQAAEMIAAYTGKIGNALRKGGVILENAYGWMNPQPKFNRVTQTLESLQNGASTIQMVTQVPLDVVSATTELTTASTEFVKAIKEDTPANKATPIPEPDELKAKETKSKTDSQPSPFDFSDLFDGED